MAGKTITVNRAPVLTLWATVVAERLGFDWDSALTLGKAVAGFTAQAKGRHLGIYQPAKEKPGKKPKRDEEFFMELCGRGIPAKSTDDGIRAMALGLWPDFFLTLTQKNLDDWYLTVTATGDSLSFYVITSWGLRGGWGRGCAS